MIKTSQYCFDIAIGVEGSSRGTLKNFLQENDLLAFKLSVMSGVAVPYIVCSIKVHNRQVASYFKEKSVVEISFGPTESRMETLSVVIGTVNQAVGEPSSTELVVSFEAVIQTASSKFVLNTDTNVYTGTSLKVLQDFSKKFFGSELDTDITEVNETDMVWRQDSEINSRFIANVWLHMNIKPDVPLLYIDKNLQMHLLSLNNIKKGKTVTTFVPSTAKSGKGQTQFFNDFIPQSYKNIMNAVSSNQIVPIMSADSGQVNVEFPEANKAQLASTTETEESNTGYTVKENRIESANVYRGYKKAYQYNRTQLLSLSSIVGYVELIGYRDNFKIYDKVEVSGVSPEHTGMYVITDIEYVVAHGQGFITTVYLTRDNINQLEKYVLKEDEDNSFFKFKSEIQKMYSFVRNLRKYVQMARYVIDGSLHRDLIKFVTRMKTELLKSFTVAGIALDFNSMDALVNSLKSIGNSLLNTIIKTYLPAPFNTALQNFALQNPSLKALLSKLLTQYAPEDVRLLIVEISGLLADITAGLDRVAKNASNAHKQSNINSNQGDTSFKDTPSGVVDVVVKDKGDDVNTEAKVKDIIDDILDRTKDVDIPIPVIQLSDSQKLLNDVDLSKLIADLIVTDLSDKGYLTGIDNFEDILLGKTAMSFSTINKLNANAGLVMYSRFWGVFSDPTELTDFYITDQFRDMYRTPEFTRLVSAKKSQRIFVAYPTSEDDLRIFINGTLESMEVMTDIDLGVRNKNGGIILYNVYLSPKGYNSNSNILEVRRGA